MDLMRIVRGGTPINLDRQRLLFFDKQATASLASTLGVSYRDKIYKVSNFTPKTETAPASAEFALVDMDAFQFALFVGLRAEAAEKGEDPLTFEACEQFIQSGNFDVLFTKVITAIMNGTGTPPRVGKTVAAAASPTPTAKPGPQKKTPASTSSKRSGSLTVSSSKRQKSSGARRSASTT